MKPAVFLDRDGIINVDKHHVFRIEDIEFIEGIFELVAFANLSQFPVIVITNQSGIARGKYAESDFFKLMEWMKSVFLSNGSSIDAVYFCPTHPDFPDKSRDVKYSGWRKPECGMIIKAATDLNIDLSLSFLIGDNITDIQAGVAAGIHNLLMVNESIKLALNFEKYDVCNNLSEALFWLKKNIESSPIVKYNEVDSSSKLNALE